MQEGKLWFKRKRWGYGWSPNTKQGWLVTGTYLLVIGLLTLIFLTQDKLNLPLSLSVGVLVIISTAVLFFVTHKHAPEPHWQWGEDKEKGDK